MDYYDKYIKYKNKYIGGNIDNKTYIDFITKESVEKININDDKNIIKILTKYLVNIDKLICLDFHGVTDLYDLNEKIPSNLPKIVILYIGGKPKTILDTTNTIKSRLMTNDIILGIIVYNKNTVPSCGTKGWIILKFIDINKNIKIHFIDDSEKNITCVDNVKSNNINTYYVDKHKNPKIYLTKILNKITSSSDIDDGIQIIRTNKSIGGKNGKMF